ncbi:MAG: beta-lactamase family protein [Rhodobacteraceae bacterium]|nr:beta-lactamase family protein [Paracoccaceae bacterium]
MTRFDPARLNRIATWQESYVADRKFPGSSVLIRQAGEEVYFNAAGRRNLEADLPFTRDTLVRIFSMTKPITSVALMMFVERGLVSLSTPLSDILPEFTDPVALVPGATSLDQVAPCASPTMQQVLTHMSGFSYAFNAGIVPDELRARKIGFDRATPDLSSVIRDLAQVPLAFAPGERWEYSVGIDVIGRVIEVLAGKPFGTVLAENIFASLRMASTGFRVPPGTGDRFAALYTPLAGDPMALLGGEASADTLRLDEAPEGSRYHVSDMHSGGGGLVSTIDDFMAFSEMLRQGGRTPDSDHILSPATLRFMMRNHLAGEIADTGPSSFAEQPMQGMGFGIGGAVVLDPARAGTPGHSGDFSWGGMASTFFWMDPQADMSVVFFTQLSPSSSYPSRGELKALVHGAML